MVAMEQRAKENYMTNCENVKQILGNNNKEKKNGIIEVNYLLYIYSVENSCQQNINRQLQLENLTKNNSINKLFSRHFPHIRTQAYA